MAENETVDPVLIHEGSVLVVERGGSPFRGQDAFPGGHVEGQDEPGHGKPRHSDMTVQAVNQGRYDLTDEEKRFVAAAARELYEETSVPPSRIQLAGKPVDNRDRLFDPRYENLDDRNFDEDMLKELRERLVNEEYPRRGGDFNYRSVPFKILGQKPEVEGRQDAESARWRPAETLLKEGMAFNQDAVLKTHLN